MVSGVKIARRRQKDVLNQEEDVFQRESPSMGEEKEYIIQIRSAFKRYGNKNVILRGLNMSVEKGIIYGLLGPSGCGKTTLLGCVGGLLNLDSGTVTVNLASRRQLGYMPQDIALMELFTVSEMFQYFGRINALSPSKLKERGHDLLELMDLPAEKFWERVISTLSGGQQRRISLAVTLLHEPQLLILDEPTVGLDPLLSNKLWNFFTEISGRYGKTLIITTHYIEEARHANMIGLMRNGVLLAEDSPMNLLKAYNCDSLEDAFLLLSHTQSIVCIENDEEYPNKSSTKPLFSDAKMWDKERIAAQLYKNTCWVKRNIPVMLFMLLLPTLLMYLFGTVYSDYLKGIPIAVVSEEMLPGTCAHPPDTVSIEARKCKPDSRLSCKFLPLLLEKSGYVFVEYKSLESAKHSVVEGKTRGLIHFDKKYSWSLIRRLDEGPLFTPDRYVNASSMKVHLDMAEMILGLKIEKDIVDSFNEFLKIIFRDCKYKIRAAGSILQFEKPVFGERRPPFIHTAIPAFIIPFLFYITTTFSSAALISEKNSGFLDRCLIAGVHYNEIILGIAVTQILMAIGQDILMFAIAYGVYHLPLQGSWYVVLTFIVLADLQGMFFGFFLGAFFAEERTVTYSAVGLNTLLFFSSSMMWPLEGAHWLIQTQMKYFPIMMAVESYRSVSLRGWGFDHYFISISVLANIGFVLFLVTIFLVASRRKQA